MNASTSASLTSLQSVSETGFGRSHLFLSAQAHVHAQASPFAGGAATSSAGQKPATATAHAANVIFIMFIRHVPFVSSPTTGLTAHIKPYFSRAFVTEVS